MKKNVSGQKIGAQMITAADGTAFTGSVTVYVTGDAGTQSAGSVGSGACTHEGNGYHTYAPAQAETNYDLVAFTFTGTGAIPATVQVFTSFPQTGDAYATATAIETDTQDIQSRLPAALVSGRIDASVGAMASGVLTATAIAADAITAAKVAADVTTELQSGLATASALSTVAGYIDTEVAAILAAVDTEVAAIKAKTDNLPSDPADQSAVEAAILAAWTTALTESYAANGAAFTPAQGLYAIHQMLMDFAISGTTISVKRLGGTEAFAVTLDDATTPTSASRD